MVNVNISDKFNTMSEYFKVNAILSIVPFKVLVEHYTNCEFNAVRTTQLILFSITFGASTSLTSSPHLALQEKLNGKPISNPTEESSS